MQPLEFLAAVLPSAGVYCVAELSSRKKEHVYADALADLAPALEKFNERKMNTYFALATFGEAGNRLAENARFMRSLFIDLDCDADDPKKYPDQQAALDALHEFLQVSTLDKLCAPLIVSSGGGIHVYWPFTEHVSIDVWKPAAENFKRLCKALDLRIDHTVTADAARVLRVPGTTNWKLPGQPRPVKVLQESLPAGIPFEALATAIKERLVVTGSPAVAAGLSLPGKRPTRAADATSVKLIENSYTSFKNILVRSVEGTGCAQVKHYLENAADDGMEPLWRGMLSLTKVCADGDKAALKLSALHPYPVERMEQKLREIKGPYPCTKLDSENPGVCPGCRHWGKITNPLALGRELHVDNTEKQVEQVAVPEAVKHLSVVPVTRPTPPKGYSYGKTGGVYREKVDEDGEGNVVKHQVMVVPYDLFVVDLLNQQGEHTVYMMAMRPEGPTQITLPQRAVVSKDETTKALAAQNVVAAFGSGNDKNLFEYTRACVEEVSAKRQAMPVPVSFGWQDDGSFVTNAKIFTADGMMRSMPMPGLDNVVACTSAKGSLENWRRVVDMMLRRKNFDMLAVGLGVALGSPLMGFSKLHGLTFHAGSSQSGTGKSLSLNLASSVWGDSYYRINPSTSKVAMQQRAGLLRSLPLVSDEVTTKNRQDFEWFPEFVFDISEGQGKERMESGSNKERLNLTRWSLLALVSSNTHALDYLSGGRKHSSEGEMRRMLEWTISEEMKWEPHEIELLRSLTDNYGHAGLRYAAWLASHRNDAHRIFLEVYGAIRKEFEFTNDERYWHAAVTSCIAGFIMAGSAHAAIIDLPVPALTASLRGIVLHNRGVVKSSVRSAEDILNAYIREYYGRFVVVRALEGKLMATLGEKGVIDESITRSQIAGRVEHNVVPGHINFYIEEQVLKAYCSTMSFGYSDFKKQLTKIGVVEAMKKDMLSKTKGPQMRVNALRICRPIEAVEELLQETNDAAQRKHG